MNTQTITHNSDGLTGKLAFITGTGTGTGIGIGIGIGIGTGLACAPMLVDAGAKVTIAGRRQDVLEQAAADLGDRGSWITGQCISVDGGNTLCAAPDFTVMFGTAVA